MTEIIIALLAIIIIIQIIILIKILKPSDKIDKSISELSDKFISVESVLSTKFDSLPERIVSSSNSLMQEKFIYLESRLSQNNTELIEKFANLDKNLTVSLAEYLKKNSDEISQFKDQLAKNLKENFEGLTYVVEDKLDKISRRVQDDLMEGFNKTNETFQNIIERLAKIDEAQKNIESLSTNIVSLQSILTDKKSRGIYGEVQLYQILSAVFGEVNDNVFRRQYKLSTNVVADAVVFAPEPIGMIAIDSKFPLDNYQRMIDRTLSEAEREFASKEFKRNVRKHIEDIAEKYIILTETAEHAMMFLPAESIFAELNAYHPDIIEYAYKKKVWIVSPTTFMAFLTVLQVVLTNIKHQQNVDIILNQLKKLSEEFKRFTERWNRLAGDIDKVQKDVKDIHTTSQKITNEFEKISKVEMSEEIIESSKNLLAD